MFTFNPVGDWCVRVDKEINVDVISTLLELVVYFQRQITGVIHFDGLFTVQFRLLSLTVRTVNISDTVLVLNVVIIVINVDIVLTSIAVSTSVHCSFILLLLLSNVLCCWFQRQLLISTGVVKLEHCR